jgi:hypothetical protein
MFQMRSNLIGMCSAVAAVAVAGSASAGVSVTWLGQYISNIGQTYTDPDTGDTSTSFNQWNSLNSWDFSYPDGSGGTTAAFNFNSGNLAVSAGSLGPSGPTLPRVVDLSWTSPSPTTIEWSVSDTSNQPFGGPLAVYADRVFQITDVPGDGNTADWQVSFGGQLLSPSGYFVLGRYNAVTGDLDYITNINPSPNGSLSGVGLTEGIYVMSFGNFLTSGNHSTGQLMSFTVPAPGAIALLGAAGLMGRRRRN